MTEKPQLNKKYVNLKTKNIYIVRGYATHSETNEDLVLYTRVDTVDRWWARPVDLFMQIDLFMQKFTEFDR